MAASRIQLSSREHAVLFRPGEGHHQHPECVLLLQECTVYRSAQGTDWETLACAPSRKQFAVKDRASFL